MNSKFVELCGSHIAINFPFSNVSDYYSYSVFMSPLYAVLHSFYFLFNLCCLNSKSIGVASEKPSLPVILKDKNPVSVSDWMRYLGVLGVNMYIFLILGDII